jgi:hypothetical protein
VLKAKQNVSITSTSFTATHQKSDKKPAPLHHSNVAHNMCGGDNIAERL